MYNGTKTVLTYHVNNLMITKFRFFLRQTKLNELLKLFNVLNRDRSLVGPRPCLVNQEKFISERKKRCVFKAKPEISGLAQISGITMKNLTLLAKKDM